MNKERSIEATPWQGWKWSDLDGDTWRMTLGMSGSPALTSSGLSGSPGMDSFGVYRSPRVGESTGMGGFPGVDGSFLGMEII